VNRDLTTESSKAVESQYGVDITCNNCYITGSVNGQYSYSNGINVTALESWVDDSVDLIIDEVEDAFKNITTGEAVDIEIDFNSLDVSVSEDFDYRLAFQLEDLDLYLDLSTTFPTEQTYTISLFALPILGASLTDYQSTDLEIGAFFTLDLVLSTQYQIELDCGVHFKVDKASINVDMFKNDLNDISM
jgi:hypothetical protein